MRLSNQNLIGEIITGDAFELAGKIKDKSIGLILCDPVYWEYEQYKFVAELGRRVLMQGRSVIAQAGDEHRLAAENAMQVEGMRSCPLIMEEMTGGIRQLWNTRSLSFYKPYLRVAKPAKRLKGWMPTLIRGFGRAEKKFLEWEDTPAVFVEAIIRLTDVDDIVLDPFTGEGTVPAAAKMLQRNFIAFEIDSERAERARANVANAKMYSAKKISEIEEQKKEDKKRQIKLF